jgi:hypothetical protein
MKTGRHFQPLQYALIIRDATGAKITGTGSTYDLEGTRALAASVFRVNRRATFVDIHPYIEGGSYTDAAQETVHRSGITVAPLPAVPAKEPERSIAETSASEVHEEPIDQAEAPAEVPVEQTPVKLSSAHSRRARRVKAKQEAP